MWEAREGLTTRFCGLLMGLGDSSWPRGCLWNTIAGGDVHEMLLSRSSDSVPRTKTGGSQREGKRTIDHVAGTVRCWVDQESSGRVGRDEMAQGLDLSAALLQRAVLGQKGEVDPDAGGLTHPCEPHHLRGGQSGRRKVAPERLLDG